MCTLAGISPQKKAAKLTKDEQKRLLDAMQQVSVPAPPASVCLSPIGEALIVRGLEKEFQMDFVRARTRPNSVFSGHPFMVEAAIGYGGKLPAEGNAQILRFANRVPLMYQQGACAITSCIAGITWKTYGITQAGLPVGPLLILVHIASTNVPFTSESKDAIASIPEIEKEITLSLQELGRELKLYLSRRDKNRLAEDRARAVCAIIPEIAMKVSEIVELPPPDISPIEGRIMKKLIAKRRVTDGTVTIQLNNYTDFRGNVSIYETSREKAEDANPPPEFVSTLDEEYTRVWKVPVLPGTSWKATYHGNGGGNLDIRGIEEGKLVVVDMNA